MTELRNLIWLFPVLFLFHDLEEIFFLMPWVRKNHAAIIARFPQLPTQIINQVSSVSSTAFALGVLEELILILLICFFAFQYGWYALWSGGVLAFTFHLLVHLAQVVIYKEYIPVVITSLLCLPVCAIMIAAIIHTVKSADIWIYSSFVTLAMGLNLWLIHIGMAAFDRQKLRGSDTTLP